MPALNPEQQLLLNAWQKVCLQVDGIAIGSTVHALARRGVFKRLARSRVPLEASALAEEFGAGPGYFHLAMKLLTAQGLLLRGGDIPGGHTLVSLSEAGRGWLQFLPAYQQAPAAIRAALQLQARLAGGGQAAAPELAALARVEGVDDSELGRRVRLHLLGPLLGAAMTQLAGRGVLEALSREPGGLVALSEFALPPDALAAALALLAGQGWARLKDGAVALTPEGVAAAGLAPAFYGPMSYLPTFLGVPELMWGADAGLGLDQDGVEKHLDRALDIKLSGLVFRRDCRAPFLEAALPLFDQEPLSEQPACVVDTGSGDGTVLLELYLAVREQTLRGLCLERHPLIMVGAEYTQVSREATASALSQAGVPHRVIFGDIGDPARLAADLRELGLDPAAALHLNKSVIHNRTYQPPQNQQRLSTWRPSSQAVFVSPGGGLIAAREMECNLVEFFESWRPWIGKHGMLAIEAHTVDPELVAPKLGGNLVTMLDASHGYAHQYLIEVEIYRRAVRAAGLNTLFSRDIGAQLVGRPLLSINHFKPA
jgi:hypothetical protein